METNGIQQAFVSGPTEPPIYRETFAQWIDKQAATYGKKPAILSTWQGINLSYGELAERSKHVAKALLGMGFAHGDFVGIMAGNSCQHIEVLMGGARIGCPVVSLHSTYTPDELKRAAHKTSCKLLFIASRIGRRDLSAHVEMMKNAVSSGALPELHGVLTIGQNDYDGYADGLHTYEALFADYKEGVVHPEVDGTFLLQLAEKALWSALSYPPQVYPVNQSIGTTGTPKAGMLTATNLIGSASTVADQLNLTPKDILCSPTPIFHGFGLIVGIFAPLLHGSPAVLPSDHFDAHAVLEAIQRQAPTVLIGVPTMFLAELEAMAKGQIDSSLRAAVVGGSAITPALTTNIRAIMKTKEVFVIYGMMETGVTFMGSVNGLEGSTGMVGCVMPHVCAKILNESGQIARPMEKGELYISGFTLQKGYFGEEEKTLEVMTQDKDGKIWMRTGDEAIIDASGCCHITGRIKDIIVRGGENISPLEVEGRLASHPTISEASVLGLPDAKYGEVVGCFLKGTSNAERPSDEEVQSWVRETLAWHKAPVHIFWIGEPGVADDFPRTGSGKHQKHTMKGIGERLIAVKNRQLYDSPLMGERWV
ncbi:hypothetical protein BDV38DRAFT_295124 [Aspergillus pseudotamarii]|uniref:Acetyl-CoA synthetase-like protein n=1 Tax=Aspergillus pseudotamarii TaxID=132259 RepID=A0A5N6T7T8_ASPPS|nr:uncharacterized protein BDV38DRAFT_295124 [Aspergillus pseudotamarii]KAE8142337.1 hypothetical protein BDV38DRAFT_295124 [Aspergillus pseudotamarii]